MQPQLLEDHPQLSRVLLPLLQRDSLMADAAPLAVSKDNAAFVPFSGPSRLD
jgi:hypothetical protein